MNYLEWLESQNYSNATINKYHEFFNSLKKKKLTQEDIMNILRKRNYPLVRSWLNNYVSYLKEVFPGEYDSLRVPRQRGRNTKLGTMSKFLKPEELELLFAALPKREELVCRLLYEAGARRGQILNAKVNHINFNECELLLPSNIVGAKKGTERIIIISHDLVNEIKEWINTNKLGEEDRLFNIGVTRLREIINKVSMKVLGKPVSTHWFKRSRGYYYDVILNLPLEERQYALGHSNPKTTQDRYSFNKGKSVLDKLRVIVNEE